MAWFYVDDNLYDHPKLMGLPNASLGLWVRAGSWCVRHEVDGFVPARMVGQLGSRKRDADRLVEHGLWESVDGGYRFHDWPEWQFTQQRRERRRGVDAERQRRHRSRKAGSQPPDDDLSGGEGRPQSARSLPADCPQSARSLPADCPQSAPADDDSAGQEAVSRRDLARARVPSPPHPHKEGETEERASLNVRPDTRTPANPPDAWTPAASGPHAAAAYRLVDDAVGAEHPSSIRTALAVEAAALLADERPPELVDAALRLWLRKPHLGPRALPSLASEVLRQPNGTTSTGNGIGPASEKAAAWLSIVRPTDDRDEGGPEPPALPGAPA